MKFTAITQTKHEGDNSIMREGYTSQAKKALAYAVRTAEKCGHNYVGTEHLLIGLLNVEDGTAGMVLSEFHVDAGQLTELIDRLIAPGGNTVTESRPGYTPRVRRVLENAEAEAARFKSRAVGTEHLLIAINYMEQSLLPWARHRCRAVQAEMQIPAADRRQEVERRPAKRRHWISTAGI